MSDLLKAVAYVLSNEGGFVDNPSDKGGPTKFGITLPVLSEYLGHPCDLEDVKNITQGVASDIFKKNYWEVIGLNQIQSDGVATAVLDMAVNRGVQKATDYAMLTLSKMNAASLGAAHPETFIRIFAGLIHNGYQLIVEKHPENEPFLKGWLARADRLLTLIDT